MRDLSIQINGHWYDACVDERTLLLEFIRDVANLTGTHNGCMEARCGCCAVLVDGKVIKSCNVLALQVAGASVTTVEGLAPKRLVDFQQVTTQSMAGVYRPLSVLGIDKEGLHPLQVAFHEHGALQCGFCTPGMLMVLSDYLKRNPAPTPGDIRKALSGNLCRCTGYQKIVDAALDAARQLREGAAAGSASVPSGKWLESH